MGILLFSSFSEAFDSILTTIIYLVAGFILFFIGKFVYNLFHRDIKVDHELVEKDNLAFAVAHVGYYIGLLITIGGSLLGESNGLWNDLINIGVFGLVSILLLNLSIILNDKILLRKFKVKKEIVDDQNVGTGVVEAASAIATGVILFAVFTIEGEEPEYWHIAAYWAIAQVALFLGTIVYNMILPYDVHEEIEKDNVAAGVGFAGAIVAVGWLVAFGIEGEHDTWQNTALNLTFDTGIGLVLLPIVRFGADKLLLPKRSLTDEIVNQEKPNVGAALVEAFAYIGGAVLITWTLATI